MACGSVIKTALKQRVKHSMMSRAKAAPSDRVDSVNRILTYHSVGERTHDMNVTCDQFRAQMEWLATTQSVIRVADAARGEPGIAISFDDGYRDNLTNAAPVLESLDLPATVFVVAGCLGGFLAHDEPIEANRLMSCDEIRALEAMGVEIGAHTLSHVRLAQVSEREQFHEIVESVKRLEACLGHRVSGFSYPYGSVLDYNALSIRIVREQGLEYALSNRYGANGPARDRWALRRIWVDASDTLEVFQAKVDGRLDRMAWMDSEVGIRARRVLNRVLRT